MHLKKVVVGCASDACEMRRLRKERKKGREWWNDETRELIQRKMEECRCLLQKRSRLEGNA